MIPVLTALFRRREPYTITTDVRTASGGSFITLPDGVIHYQFSGASGDSQQACIVFIPGISVPFTTWDRNFDALSTSGFRCLRFDFYGRGLSDRISGSYDLDFFVLQLTRLLDALSLHQPVHIVALSMGGAVAARFASIHPHRIRRIFFIDPLFYVPRIPFFMRHQFPATLGLLFLSEQNLVASQKTDFSDSESFDAFEPSYRRQLRYKGFRKALLATFHSLARWEIAANYEQLAASEIPTALIWGRLDRTIPFETAAQLETMLKPSLFRVIENAGHVPHYEQPEEVNTIIAAFFRGTA